MNTITVWLLIALSNNLSGNNAIPAANLGSFVDAQECQRVSVEIAKASSKYTNLYQHMVCIQAIVVKT